MVARAVEALVVRTRDWRQRGEQRRARDHALGLVGMEADLLPLAGGQRPGALPGAGADRDSPEVVDERRAPYCPPHLRPRPRRRWWRSRWSLPTWIVATGSLVSGSTRTTSAVPLATQTAPSPTATAL